MKDGVYVVCPKCHKISDGSDWTIVVEEVHRYTMRVTTQDVEDFVDYDFEVLGSELLGSKTESSEHICGYKTEGSYEKYLIKVENGKIVKMGDYWRSAGVEEVNLMATRNGLDVDPVAFLRGLV